MSAHDRYLQRALVLAKQNIADGGRPFGAVLVMRLSLKASIPFI